jgi:hypothetical protein
MGTHAWHQDLGREARGRHPRLRYKVPRRLKVRPRRGERDQVGRVLRKHSGRGRCRQQSRRRCIGQHRERRCGDRRRPRRCGHNACRRPRRDAVPRRRDSRSDGGLLGLMQRARPNRLLRELHRLMRLPNRRLREPRQRWPPGRHGRHRREGRLPHWRLGKSHLRLSRA